jgi:hypothetical protein
MGGRLTRFLNLERPRKPGETPPHGVATEARFRERRAAQVESGIEVETSDAAEQPFLRCPVCEADNTKFAVDCTNCQTRLDTEEVRAWNVKFWRQRQAASTEPPPAAVMEQNRVPGESMAREVAEHERPRLGWTGSSDSTPLGMRLLQMIPNQNLRFGVAMGMVATFFGAGTVAYVARHHPVLQTVGIVVAAGLLALFMPNRRRDWRGFRDD